nr:hypothetical protein [Tanacetum cinerariifolium]
MWSDREKRIQKIDRLARSLLIQGLLNDIYSLVDSNKTAKDLWDALVGHKLGSEYGEQDRKAAVLYEYETFKATEGELLLDTYIRYLQVINDLKKCGYSKDNYDKQVVKKADEKKQDVSRVKCYNCKKEGHFAKDCKKVKVKDYEYYKTKMLLAKKDKDEQVLLDEDQAWMESSKASSSSVDEKIFEVSYYLSESEKIFHDAIESASEKFFKNHIDSQKDYDKSDVDHNDSEEKDHLVDKLIRKFNKKIVKCQKRIKKANQQSKDFENQNKDLQDKYDVLKNQATTLEMNNKKLNEQLKELIEKNNDFLAQTKVLKDQLQVRHVVIDTHVECQEKYAKLEAERYEYMIRYSAYFDNDKRHRK